MKPLFKLTTVLSLIIFSSVFSKCTKQNSIGGNSPNTPQTTALSLTPSLPPISQNFNSSIKSKFQGIETLVNSNNLTSIQNVIQGTLADIKTICYNKYGINLAVEFNNDQLNILAFGLLYSAREKYIADGGVIGGNVSSGPGMDCFVAAVGTFLGVGQIKSIWASIVAGATAQTVVAALKLIARRVAGVLGFALMVYDVGSCLGWWGCAVTWKRDFKKTSLGIPIGPDIPMGFFNINYFNSVKTDIINFLVFTERASNNLLAENMINKVYLSRGVYTINMQFEVPAVNAYFRYLYGPI